MKTVDAIAALRAHLAKAQADRDIWRVAGLHEQYLAAYFRVEALQLQIEQLLLQADPSDHERH
jgi:hypothetical protein